MLKYDRLWILLEKKEISAYKLQMDYKITQDTIKRLKNNEIVSTKTLIKLCRLLNCKLEDIAEYVPD